MATARAVAKVKVDWSALASQVSKSDLPKLNRLRSQMDATGVKVAGLPDTLPKIDWAYYKTHASDPELVEQIEKKYSAIKIEPPKAPSKRIDDLKLAQMQDEARLERFSQVAKSYIEAAEVVKTKFENMIPVKDMTHEDWALTFPQWSFSMENPTLPPHNGLAPGLTREEAAAFEQPDPVPFATKTAWKDWEEKYKKFYL